MQRIVIRNQHDHVASGLSNEQLNMLLSGVGFELMLEPTTLEDIELTHLPDSLVNSADDIILSAITTRRLRLDRTMKALVKVLNTQLAGSELTAGATPDIELSSPGAKVIGGAIIGKPRKSGLIATMTAEIPISDGQSIFIIFHAPDDDPGVIGMDDTLIAFRFLLNKRDVTDIVAPHNGRDISLKQTTLALANAIEKNSRKFQAGLKVRQQQAQELEAEQAKVDDAVARVAEYSETALQLREKAEKTSAEVTAIGEQLSQQQEINRKLERDLELARANVTEQSNVIQMPGKNAPAINPADVSDAVKSEDTPAESAPAVTGYEQKYSGNFTGDKYQANKSLPLTEITKKIRLAIADGKRSGVFPAELRVSVTTRHETINMDIKELPESFNVYSSEYIEEYAITGSYPSGINRRHADYKALESRLLDEANQYNSNDSDSMTDYFNKHFYAYVQLDSVIDSAALARQTEQYKAQSEKASQEKAQSIESLPEPDQSRDGSEMKPIQLEDTPQSLAALGQAEITSIGDENIYMLKDGLHYYAKVQSTDSYRVGPWDFTKSVDENNSMTAEQSNPEFTPAYEMTREDWIKEQIEKGNYAEEYLNDRELYDEKAKMLENDWHELLKERAKTGKISVVSLDDYVGIYGMTALQSVFRGQYAAGIEGYESPLTRLWDKTYAQVLRLNRSGALGKGSDNVKALHRNDILKALAAGEIVPEKVMKDYPELMAPAGELEEVPEDNGQTSEQAEAEAKAAAAEPLDIPAEATAEPEPAPAEEVPEAAPSDLGISPEILEAQRDLDNMRAQQDRMKKANALVRSYVKAAEKDADKARADLLKKMAEIGFSEAVVNKMLTPNYMGRVVAFEAYELTNLNARIKSREERIKELERREEDAADGDFEYDYTINGAPVTVELDLDADRIRVSFPRLTGKAKESDPEFGMVEKIKGGANWSPSNRAWQRKITTNAKAAVAYALGFKNWSDLVAQGKLAQQEAAALDAALDADVTEQPEAATAEPAPVENAAPTLPAVDKLSDHADSETDATVLMDMLDEALKEIEATGVDEAQYSELLEKASNRVTALLEAE